MRCPTCGEENALDARYCTSCGVPLETTEAETSVVYCTQCGSENPGTASSCSNCGSVLQTSPTLTPQPLPDEPYSYGPGPVGTLPPRDVGELVSETFRVYRANFSIFFFISLIAGIPVIISPFTPQPVAIILPVIGVVFGIMASAASVSVVHRQLVGWQVTVGQSYSRAFARAPSLIGTWVVFIVILAIFLVTIVGFFYFLVRLFFWSQAIMVEGRRGPIEALGRSQDLVRGSWWRVFGIGVAFVLLFVATGIGVVIVGSIFNIFSPVAGAVVLIVLEIVITPIGYIGATLVYFDLRVRKERFTVGTLAS